ncbi:hypothetical protein [Hoeflea prorocentri]|uniref:Uncharacterized protein n=1 Tax=Hoeflea prorocentri TaxID=1922333 RepID=A0A9X3UL46_9HYPH|nr:hypothetical protein [Hoeflea prorocentri]MCY6380961.1 hypothetical protein [Hoeflea prorocentri]MDA5398761.1 hypothetical protein [Hoeflea prorocentri]
MKKSYERPVMKKTARPSNDTAMTVVSGAGTKGGGSPPALPADGGGLILIP